MRGFLSGVVLFVLVVGLAVGLNGAASPSAAAEEASAMNNARLDELIRRIEGIEGEIEGGGGAWRFRFRGYFVFVFTDERADRMRIMVPVAEADSLGKDALYRVMQANFESSLDARYAIAQDALWSAFIHPLSPLAEPEFYSGFEQTVTLAATYGTTYNSGGLSFSGGDDAPKYDQPVQ